MSGSSIGRHIESYPRFRGGGVSSQAQVALSCHITRVAGVGRSGGCARGPHCTPSKSSTVVSQATFATVEEDRFKSEGLGGGANSLRVNFKTGCNEVAAQRKHRLIAQEKASEPLDMSLAYRVPDFKFSRGALHLVEVPLPWADATAIPPQEGGSHCWHIPQAHRQRPAHFEMCSDDSGKPSALVGRPVHPAKGFDLCVCVCP